MLERIKIILNHYQLSPSGFADNLGVPRSSISHLLSGRNKPSLDFVMKLVRKYPEVNLYWLLHGEGTFPVDPATTLPSSVTPLFDAQEKVEKPSSSKNAKEPKPDQGKEVVKVVLFYKDGTFQSYDPEK